MKIGMLTDVYKPVINGVTNSIALCKREMEAAGHEVTVFTLGHQEYQDDEPRVIRSPALPISDSGYHLGLTYSRHSREILTQMDILHAHHPFISGRMATRFGRQMNVPVVFTNHTRYDLYAQARFPLLPTALTDITLESFMTSFTALCDLVVAPSEGLKRVVLEWGVDESRVVVIPNGVDLAMLTQSAATAGDRSSLDIPKDAVVMVYCGRLAPEKNLDMLLEAFRGAAQAVAEAFLLVVGDGPDEERLRRKASGIPRARLMGSVAYTQVGAYLSMADFFVTPSITEVHPLTVIEALAVGLPVLGIHSPGISDTVRDGIDGSLSDHNLAAFTAKMVRLLLEPQLRKCMAACARERGQEFDIRSTSATLLGHYQRLLSEVTARPPKEKLWEMLAREVQQVLGE